MTTLLHNNILYRVLNGALDPDDAYTLSPSGELISHDADTLWPHTGEVTLERGTDGARYVATFADGACTHFLSLHDHIAAKVSRIQARRAPTTSDDADDLDDDDPDFSGVTLEGIRRFAAAVTPADADAVKMRPIITITPAQAKAIRRTYSLAEDKVPWRLAGILWLTVRGMRGCATDWRVDGEGALAMSAACTHAQSLRAREMLHFIAGRAEVDWT
jgi:hypothetical protein